MISYFLDANFPAKLPLVFLRNTLPFSPVFGVSHQGFFGLSHQKVFWLMFDFLNQPGIIKFSQGPFQYIWHAHGFSVQDYLTLSNDSVFQLPSFISNVPLPNYIHLFQIFRGVCKYFLTAVNLSFSLRTLAKSIPLFETRLDFCSATGSPSTTLFRLRTDCVVLTYLFY